MAHFLLCTNQNIDNGVQVFSVCKLYFSQRDVGLSSSASLRYHGCSSILQDGRTFSSSWSSICRYLSSATTPERTVWTQSRSSSEIEPANSLQNHNPEWACACEMMTAQQVLFTSHDISRLVRLEIHLHLECQNRMGLVRITSWYPPNSRSIHRMTGLGSNFVWTLTGLAQALLTKKENNIITTKVSCRELGILLLRRHLILVVKNFPSRCESEPKFVVKQRWRPTQRPKREVLYFTHKYLNGSLVHKLKCVCSKVVGADVLNGWCKWWNINGVEVQETWTLC